MNIAVGAVDAVAARTLDWVPTCNHLWISSFEISCSLGVPDSDLIRFEQLCERIQAVCRGSALPLIIDASNGVCYGNDRLAHFADSLNRAVTIVIDDTRFPRVNSFSPNGNVLADLQQTRSRLHFWSRKSRDVPSIRVCLRTEHYRIYGDIEGTIIYLRELFDVEGLDPPQLLIHGYDLVSKGASALLNRLPIRSLVALSTLSPGRTIGEFRSHAIDTLIIPNILTIQRVLEGVKLLDEILSGDRTLDGPYRPFSQIRSEIEFP
ncbi:isocitrate lyase/phosphoenolpyruvate mutase family protein [Virgisporangium ochraceum]|uniref:isocitrate lyase/phosphoenolpyruvate mutase family protein n=1 Tax=Virgisporangium ochraceum TaxID=65505 RepID=UPI0019415F1D|nr:isocitrate lyase/phosphoenolpyruvate mutase family protein [Virgisporangium ochraceum]